jgi:hypothetical protein
MVKLVFRLVTGASVDTGSAKKLLEDAFKGKDKFVKLRSDVVLGERGLNGNAALLDEARILFRAWSEDDLTKSFGEAEPVGRLKDLGERSFKNGDQNVYERGFGLPLSMVAPGSYALTFGSGDDGWYVDVGIGSTLSLVIGSPLSKRSGMLLQSGFGRRGNFELVLPLASGGLAHRWRDNDATNLPWKAGSAFGGSAGKLDAVSLIQSNFSSAGHGAGNLELVARAGDHLEFFYLPDSGGPGNTPGSWQGPLEMKVDGAPLAGIKGNPALIQSGHGVKGNFELVVPLAAGGLGHYWRDNDASGMPWKKGMVPFGTGFPIDGVALIQSTFSAGNGPGNLELVARTGDRLVAFYRPDSGGPNHSPGPWKGPFDLMVDGAPVAGVAGIPALIQGRFGETGNFELVVPLAAGGLQHYWRDNDSAGMPWRRGAAFGTSAGSFDAVSLIQSNFQRGGQRQGQPRGGGLLR